jgi:predicted nuclease with TOPRIM domain
MNEQIENHLRDHTIKKQADEIERLLGLITDLEKENAGQDAAYLNLRERFEYLKKQVAELEGENTDLNDRCEDIKNETLEEAAKVAEDAYIVLPIHDKRFSNTSFGAGCEFAAAAIRALKQEDKS